MLDGAVEWMLLRVTVFCAEFVRLARKALYVDKSWDLPGVLRERRNWVMYCCSFVFDEIGLMFEISLLPELVALELFFVLVSVTFSGGGEFFCSGLMIIYVYLSR